MFKCDYTTLYDRWQAGFGIESKIAGCLGLILIFANGSRADLTHFHSFFEDKFICDPSVTGSTVYYFGARFAQRMYYPA